MKKVLLFLAVCLVVNSAAYAKDYAKLQIQEMKKAQKFNTTDKYYADYKVETKQDFDFEIKDPKLIKLSGYEQVDSNKLAAKKAQDDLKYAKIKTSLVGRKTDDYNAQAYGEDYYKVYRIAERIIRANNLDYMAWRIAITKDVDFNAYSTQTNLIVINTGAYDTLSHNDDALALLIGHEMGHALLGHSARKMDYIRRIERAYAMRNDNPYAYPAALRVYYNESKKMEYAADTEGAKLVSRAGYDLSSAKETISFINTLDDGTEYYSHPSGAHRLQNYAESRKYFMEDEWKKQGVYNIYKSNVIMPRLSSDRKSLVLGADNKQAREDVYKTESMSDVYTRFAYKSYLDGDFKKAEKYFAKLLDLDKNNPVAYLYFSYTEECLYKKTGKQKYLKNAKAFASYAEKLDSKNVHIKKQVEAL